MTWYAWAALLSILAMQVLLCVYVRRVAGEFKRANEKQDNRIDVLEHWNAKLQGTLDDYVTYMKSMRSVVEDDRNITEQNNQLLQDIAGKLGRLDKPRKNLTLPKVPKVK